MLVSPFCLYFYDSISQQKPILFLQTFFVKSWGKLGGFGPPEPIVCKLRWNWNLDLHQPFGNAEKKLMKNMKLVCRREKWIKFVDAHPTCCKKSLLVNNQ